MLGMLNALAVSFDLPILDWIQAHLQSGFLDFIMPIITLFGDGGIFWIACAVILLFFPKTRRTGLGMGFALLMGLVICNMILKPIVARPRPYDLQMTLYGREILLLIGRQSDFSFPSGHTAASFAAVFALRASGSPLWKPALAVAAAIAFSRLYLYVHWPSDVLGGALLGAFLGWAAGKAADSVEQVRLSR